MVIPLTDGVYVDISNKNHKTRLAFVVIKDRKVIRAYRILWHSYLDSNDAEATACRIALREHPNMEIFCDNQYAARKMNVNWISRCYNSIAHKTARRGKL